MLSMVEVLKRKRRIPFDFVLDYLHPKNPVVKSLFSAYGVYVDGKIVFALRDRKDFPEDNGVWIATTVEHHASLRKILPSMRSIKLLGKRVTGWQVLPASSDDFEASVIRACELVLKGDPRIAKIPKSRRRKLREIPSQRMQ